MADFEGWAQVWPEQVVDHRPLPRLPRWLASDTVAGGKFLLKRRGRAMKLGTHLTWLWSSEICLVLGFEKGGVETAVMSISNMFSNTVQSWTKNFPTTGVSSMRRVASLSPSWQGLRTLNGQQQNPRNLLLRSFATGSLRERFLDFQSLRKYLSLQVWCVGDWWRDYGFLDGSLAGKENKRTTEGESEMIGNTHKTFKNYFSRWTLNSQKFRCVWWNPTPHTAHLPQHCRLGDSGRSFVLCLFIWSEIENVHIMIELLSIWHPIGDKTTITTRQQFSLRENIKIGLYARWNSAISKYHQLCWFIRFHYIILFWGES